MSGSPGCFNEQPLMRLPHRYSLKPEIADIVGGLRKAGRRFVGSQFD
jgi:hypothetical protein